MTLAVVPADRDTALMAWRAVDPESLPREWSLYASLVRRAVEAGEGSHSERDVMLSLMLYGGRSQLWVFGAPGEELAAICITEIVDFPKQRKCLVRWIAGEWPPFADHFNELVIYAQSQGCPRIETWMRKGLTRKLPPEWTVRYVIAGRDC